MLCLAVSSVANYLFQTGKVATGMKWTCPGQWQRGHVIHQPVEGHSSPFFSDWLKLELRFGILDLNLKTLKD